MLANPALTLGPRMKAPTVVKVKISMIQTKMGEKQGGQVIGRVAPPKGLEPLTY
jgi:hypothetical protein